MTRSCGCSRSGVADAPEVTRTVRVGDFEYCPDSGTLLRLGDGASAERLAPKPAALLAMLVDRRGGLVTRTEIRDQLWGDVTVDFDNSLNYCVRQVRLAFGDNATTPRYIETVPGRGYRLKPELFAAPTENAQPDRRGISRRAWVAIAIGGVALGGGAWFALRKRERLRIAIMPFATATMPPAFALRCNQVEARVLADLTTRGRDFLDVIGPRTTGPLVAENLSVPRIAEKLAVDHVVNARLIGEEMLFELIRTSDRAHIYARRVSEAVSVETVAGMVVSGMLAALATERA